MAWNTTEANESTVYAHSEGSVKEFKFNNEAPLSEAVEEVASEMGLGTVIVKNDGTEIQPEAGQRPLKELGKIEIFPKFAGAI